MDHRVIDRYAVRRSQKFDSHQSVCSLATVVDKSRLLSWTKVVNAAPLSLNARHCSTPSTIMSLLRPPRLGLPTPLRHTVVVLAIAVAGTSALSQQYCSNQNTGSDYSAGTYSQLIARVIYAADAPLVQCQIVTNPTEHVRQPALATHLPSSKEVNVGAQTTPRVPSLRPALVVWRVQVIHMKTAETNLEVSLDTLL